MSADSNPPPRRLLRIFLCHSSDDKPEVRSLYQRLINDGFNPWLDEEDLMAGQDWQRAIPKAVQTSDVVLICLSKKSINKAGYVQKEIKFALDVAEEQPEGTIFLIPVKLEECSIPERLSLVQWINLFDKRGYERLVRALNYRAGTLGITTSKNTDQPASLSEESIGKRQAYTDTNPGASVTSENRPANLLSIKEAGGEETSKAEGDINEASTSTTDPGSQQDSIRRAEKYQHNRGMSADSIETAEQLANQAHRALSGRLKRTPRYWIIALTFVAVGIAFVVFLVTGNKISSPTTVANNLNERSFDGFSFVHFSPREEQRLRDAVAPLLLRQCADVFARAGLRSPAEVAAAAGVELRPSQDLYLYPIDQLGLVQEQTRRAYIEKFNSQTQAASVPPIQYGVQLTTDGRARIFLNDSAFIGESFLFRWLSLRDVLIHEFIHVGGQPPTPGWMGSLQHDLAGFEHYDEIMSACRS